MRAQDRFRLGEDLRLLLTRRRASKICRRRYRTTAVVDDSAPASSQGLQGLLANFDSVIPNEASADGLNEECQRPNPQKDERDFLLGQ